MAHLSPVALIDLAEGRATAAQRRHADACAACRASAAELNELMSLAATDRTPDPSPLFWDHLSARVRDAVRQDPQPKPWWHLPVWRWAPVSIAAIVVVTAGIGLLNRSNGARPTDGLTLTPATMSAWPAQSEGLAAEEPVEDGAWWLMSQLATDVVFDEVAAPQLAPSPGSADRAADQLSAADRAELARLLKEEITRPQL